MSHHEAAIEILQYFSVQMSLKRTNEYSESVNRKTDNTMAKRKRAK